MGLILGYIAIEYSIKWSIILHIANNFILGDVIGGLFGLLPDDVEGIAFTVFLGIGFVIGFVLLIIRRKEWISWLKENAAPGSYYLKISPTSVPNTILSGFPCITPNKTAETITANPLPYFSNRLIRNPLKTSSSTTGPTNPA